jgi:DNA-binding MarR family transcriptional regulator
MAQRAVAPMHERHGLGHLVMRVARDLRTLADRNLEPLGLTMQQAELLMAIYLRAEVPARHHATLLLTDEAGVSRLVDRLEGKGLVRRRPGRDRRSLSLEVTAAGRRVIASMRRRRELANRRLRAGLTDEEVEAARRVLTRVLENIASMPRALR